MTRTINNVVVKEQTKYNVAIDEGNSYAHIPMSIGQSKGDMIGFTGQGAPVHIQIGADGSVLVADSTEPAGFRWGVAASGGGIELQNNSGALILAGSICQLDADSEGVVLASNGGLGTKSIVVAVDDVYAGEYGQFVSWDNKASVLCQPGTYAAGDTVRLSTTAGIGWDQVSGNPIGKVIKDTTLASVGVVQVFLEKPIIIPADMMLDGFEIVKYSKTVTLSAKTSTDINFTPNESGYKVLGIVGWYVTGSGATYSRPQYIHNNSGNIMSRFRNEDSQARTLTFTIEVLFIRNDVNVPVLSKTL